MNSLDAENYIVFSDGIPIGAGTLFIDGKIGGIFNIAVLPEYQKKGYGRAIMEFLMYKAHEYGLERLVLLSSSIAEKFYLDLGYEKVFDIDIYASASNSES